MQTRVWRALNSLTLHPYDRPQASLPVLPGLVARTLRRERRSFTLEALDATTMMPYLEGARPLGTEDLTQLVAQAGSAVLLVDTAIRPAAIRMESEA